jgi:hypothetical protein
VVIEDTALTLKKSMRNIKLDWNDSQADKIETELVAPLIANAMRLSQQADDALATVARAREEL